MSFSKWLFTPLAGLSLISGTWLNAQPSHTSRDEADYVIVGVGTAGAVLAKKLTDDKKTSVIALHLGKNLSHTPLIKFSANAPITVLAALLGAPFSFDTSLVPDPIRASADAFFASLPDILNQLYVRGLTIPQTNAAMRQLLWVMATPLGGASSINAGAWCRETNEVNSQWEEIAGPEWSVDRIQAVYKSLEKFHGETTDPAARGYHGPIDVRQYECASELGRKFTQAIMLAANVPYVLDYNDPNTPIGASYLMQVTQKGPKGKYRVSSATAFLNSEVMTPSGFGVEGRQLRVLFDSLALKTIWDGNTAIGVQYIKDGVMQEVYARKGVIVCAGLRSSTFLMYSGVGPASVLTTQDIPVVFDNPNVGQGLADQPRISLFYATKPEDSSKNPNNIFGQIAWLPAVGGDPTSRQVRFTTFDVVPGLTLVALDLCQPQSRGSITIKSGDPSSQPVIDFGILSNSADLTLYQNALQTYVAQISEILNLIDSDYELLLPDPTKLNDLSYVTTFIQENVASNQHFQSHCRMAPLNQGGVVDSFGRVYGVNNLLVADDSIVPLDMDGSPMASAYLIAANIARLLGFG